MSTGRKYNRRVSRSKYVYRTHVVHNTGGGRKGQLIIGKKQAKADIEHELGFKIDHWKERHTKTHWVWLKPVGVPAAMQV